MPLLNHFHPSRHPRHHWESFHSNWATRLADMLNDQWLPPEFIAEEHTHADSRLEFEGIEFPASPTAVSYHIWAWVPGASVISSGQPTTGEMRLSAMPTEPER